MTILADAWPAGLVFLLVPLACYALGSVPFGLILCKAVKGVDIREHGSRNIGAANAGRVCGWPFFAATLLLDFAKGVVPVLLGGAVASWGLHAMWSGVRADPARLIDVLLGVLRPLYGVCAIVGHTFPVYLRFKGGKAVAAGFGVFVGLAPAAALIAFGVWVLLFVAFRYVSLASMTAAVAAPVVYAALHWSALADRLPVFAFAVAVAALVIARHRTNIQRLIAGTEPKFIRGKGQRRTDQTSADSHTPS